MISLYIFLVAVVFTYALNLIIFLNSYSFLIITLLVFGFIVAMILVNALIATACCKWFPDKWFSDKFKFYQVSKKESRFYEKIGIKKWKDKTAELGILNGFRKNKISDPNNPEYIKKFILETNKGFLNHFISLFASFLVIFILPIKFWLTVGLPVALTSFILNLIPVAILRYNMPRLQVMLKFAERNLNKNT